jgi:hypothetical protein
MKRLITTTLSLFILIGAMFAQDNGNHANYYRTSDAINNDKLIIEPIAAFAKDDYSRVKFKMVNKTADYILIYAEQCEFVFEHGKYNPVKKLIVIPPKKSVNKTLEVKGDNKFHVGKFAVNLSGYYQLSTKGMEHKGEDFVLPANKNDFEAGPFHIDVNGEIIKETKITEVPFKVAYHGDKVGILDATHAVIKLESGQEFRNTKKTSKFASMSGANNLMFPGETIKMTTTFEIPGKIADMQFANMDIVWKNTFIESSPEKIEIPTINFELDPGLTEGKNN